MATTNMRSTFTILLSCVIAINLSAQKAIDNQFAGPFISGYNSSIAGEEITYHSFHPYANRSLLSRTTTGKMSIEWTTDPVPADLKDTLVRFLWIGGYSTGTSNANRWFDLCIDEKPVLSILTKPGPDTSAWIVRGKDGISLAYRHVWLDHVNDAFGYFCLEVPARLTKEGASLRLKLTGRKQDDDDWYMTFEHSLRQKAELYPLPALMKKDGQNWQAIRLVIDYPRLRGIAHIDSDAGFLQDLPVKLGINVLDLPVPEVKGEKEIIIHVALDGTRSTHPITLKPVVPREIYMLHHSHNDIGYTDIQPNILKLQVNNIRQAMQLIEKTRAYPEEARFKWNTEIMWAVEEFLKSCTPAEKEAFFRCVREGSMGMQALYANILTGLCRPEELMRVTQYATRLSKSEGVPIQSAMVSDIPGFSWNLVPALSQAGIRYFSSGPNHSDRIGHSTEAWGDKPFWWVSPSGTERILFWMAGKGYSLFHYTTHIASNATFSQKLFNYLDELDSKSYPYSMVQVRYTVYSDNGPTDSTLSDFVKDWNEKYASPKLIISTADAMFHIFENRYGNELPSWSGDFTPYWEDGALSSAEELAVTRRSSESLVQSEILAAMLQKEVNGDSIAEAWKNVHLFDEHTWGAHNSISEPDDPEVLKQWEIKQAFAVKADLLAKTIRQNLLGFSGSDIEVMNTLSWARSGIVRIPHPLPGKNVQLVDPSGKPILSQMLSTGELAFLASEVPALGSIIYKVVESDVEEPERPKNSSNKLTNGLLTIQVDGKNGSILSLVDEDSKREFAGRYGKDGLNSWVFMAGKLPILPASESKCRITRKENGPLVNSILVSSKAPASKELTREITLYKGIRRVDIRNSVVKISNRKKEAMYFGFPVNLNNPVHRIDLGLGVVIPDLNQLDGACRDFYSAQRWVDLSNEEAGLTITVNEAPLVETGCISDEEPHTTSPVGWLEKASSEPVFWSYALNNYWHTNYKADQEGLLEFNYSLIPHAAFEQGEAARAGLEMSQALLARKSSTLALAPLLRLSNEDYFISAIHASQDGRAYMIRIVNLSGKAGTVELLPGRFSPSAVYESSLLEEEGRRLSGPFSLPAFGVLTLRCNRH